VYGLRVQVIYALEELPKTGKSIFLAGPTPRTSSVASWRPEALELLREHGFTGSVFVPEPREGDWAREYFNQIEWEENGLYAATCILFWVPRDKVCLPGLTTNDEWGFWKASGKVVFGAPPNAESVRYQRYYATKYGVPQSDSLEGTIVSAIQMTQLGQLT